MSQAKSEILEYWRERVLVTYRLHPDLKTSNVMIVWHHPSGDLYNFLSSSVKDMERIVQGTEGEGVKKVISRVSSQDNSGSSQVTLRST